MECDLTNPSIGDLIHILDARVNEFTEKPSKWKANAFMALLVGVVNYPRGKMAYQYRVFLVWKAVCYWNEFKLSKSTINFCVSRLDDFPVDRLRVAYLGKQQLLDECFEKCLYGSDHTFLLKAKCPIIFLCLRKNYCILDGHQLPEENVLLHDENKIGSCLNENDEIDHTSIVVKSSFFGEIKGLSFFRRCPKCNLMHFHDHAEKRELVDGIDKPQVTAYYLYSDFDNENYYFQVSHSTAVCNKDLFVYETCLLESNSHEASTRIINTLCKTNDDTEIYHDKMLINAWYKWTALRWSRDLLNPRRCSIRRGITDEFMDRSNYFNTVGYWFGDEFFESKNFWLLMNWSTMDEYFEVQSLIFFDEGFKRWMHHKCCNAENCSTTFTSDGDLNVSRLTCLKCWRKPALKSKYCHLGEDGHHLFSEVDHAKEHILKNNLGAAVDSLGIPTSFKPIDCTAGDLDYSGPQEIDDIADKESQENTFIGKILEEKYGHEIDGLSGRAKYILVQYAGSQQISWIKLRPEKSEKDEKARRMMLPRAVEEAWMNSDRRSVMYVCDPPPSNALVEGQSFSKFDFDANATRTNDEKSAIKLSCNTHKDKMTRTAKTFGWICMVFNCGICACARELYRSEGKHSVCVFYATCLLALFEKKKNIPLFICYDDACHLVQRSMSLMGQHWIFAVMVCIVICVDKFHFVNHKDLWCLRCLNPYRYDQLIDKNSEVCEQLFRYFNRFKHVVLNKPGGKYRFFLLRMLDLKNMKQIKMNNNRNTNSRLAPRDATGMPAEKTARAAHKQLVESVKDKSDNLPIEFRTWTTFDPSIIQDNYDFLKKNILRDAVHYGERLSSKRRMEIQRDLRDFYVDKIKEKMLAKEVVDMEL